MKRNPLDSLEDMLAHAGHAVAFLEGMTEEEFSRDIRTRYAVLHALQIVGEAARSLPPEIKESFPQLPWRQIVGMRNILVHEYLGVDLGVVFATVREFLPELIAQLPAVIAELDQYGDQT